MFKIPHFDGSLHYDRYTFLFSVLLRFSLLDGVVMSPLNQFTCFERILLLDLTNK